MGIALDLLDLLGLVVLAVLEAVAAVLPVVALDVGAIAVALVGAGVAAVAVVAAASLTATASTATTATAPVAASTARSRVARVAVLAAVRVGALPLGLDALLLALHLGVLLLAHEGEGGAVEGGGRVEGEELLLGVLRVELDEDAALEGAVLLAALADHDGAEGAEELLEGDLAGLGLGAEALDVGAAAEVVGRGALQAEEEVDGGRGVGVVAVAGGHGDGLLALDGLVAGPAELGVVDDDQVAALAEGVHDGAVGLEAAHALELGDVLDADGAVLGAVELLEEVLVGDEVVRGEVELDLVADLDGVVRFGQVLELVGARLPVLEATASAATRPSTSTASATSSASTRAAVTVVTVIAAVALLVVAIEGQDLLAVVAVGSSSGGGRSSGGLDSCGRQSVRLK